MNKLFTVVQDIPLEKLTWSDLPAQIVDALQLRTKVYSYLVLPIIKRNEFIGIKIKWTIAQTEKYNTLSVDDAQDTIFVAVNNYDTKLRDNKPICFKQPSLELMLLLYQPLMQRLVMAQQLQWPRLEYKDLMQLCSLSMIKLYKKGYYIHKSLLTQTFYNDVLMYLRPYKREPQVVVSLEGLLYDSNEDSKDLDIIDTIATDDEFDTDDEDIVWLRVKPILVSIVGERQLQQLSLIHI